MEIPEILQALERSFRQVPRAALEEAAARREEITPHLLGVLEEVIANPQRAIDDQEYMAHLYAMYLLAQFRETRAYPVIVRLFSIPGETVFDIFGDLATQDLGRILASVSGGDISGITALIEDDNANEYVRWAAFEGLVTLVACGVRTREEVMAYFAGLFRKLPRKLNHVWTGLANACADLWPGEMLDELRQAYDDGLIDTSSIKWSSIERAALPGKEKALEKLARRRAMIGDVAGEISWWACFKESQHESGQRQALEDGPPPAAKYATTTPYVRPEPKVGRNDPCPCGSGKKYKKCCAV